MCSTNVMSVVDAETTRRRFLRSIGVAAAGVGATAIGVRAQSRRIAILSAGKIGVENLAGLDEMLRRTERRRQTGDSDQSLIFIGGLKTRGGSGSPVRALALL